jgi:hypothetical protein
MLWDEIARDPDSIPIPEHHKAILQERLQRHREHPEEGEPWSVVRDRILSQLQSR